MNYLVRGVPQSVADEVRRTHRSPGYGHPAHHELAGGTGPCRCCLKPFVPGVDHRLLFTYRPPGRADTLAAPGPVFIHSSHCEAWSGDGFPKALRELPLALEARAPRSRVIGLCTRGDADIGARILTLFGQADVEWLHVRHAEAGCFIAAVEKKGPAVSRGA
jgi:hypothetical protein